MSVVVSETPPHVFVVDSQATYARLPNGGYRRQPRAFQTLLSILVGLSLLGVVVEGCFIYHLYKTKNLPNTAALEQTVGTRREQITAKEPTEILPIVQRPTIQRRPSAHLMDIDSNPMAGTWVIEWSNTNTSTTFTYLMDYKHGRLLVQQEGFYYLYSKVDLLLTEECSSVQHRFMKKTGAYDEPIPLMTSDRFNCRSPRDSTRKIQTMSWTNNINSFLGGVYHLQAKDEIYVTIEDGKKMQKGDHTDNFMGAFMIY